jgi:hypothetical protein
MKKQNTKFLLIIVALITVLASCKKDATVIESNFTFQDTVHVTDHGYISKVSSTATQSAYFIFICSPQLAYANNKFTGNGDLVLLYISSDSPAEILSGMYVYNVNLITAGIFLNYNADISPAHGDVYPLEPKTSSTANIDISGDIYNIDYKLTLAKGKVLKGNYKGNLENVTPSTAKSNRLFFFEK